MNRSGQFGWTRRRLASHVDVSGHVVGFVLSMVGAGPAALLLAAAAAAVPPLAITLSDGESASAFPVSLAVSEATISAGAPRPRAKVPIMFPTKGRTQQRTTFVARHHPPSLLQQVGPQSSPSVG